MIAPRDPFQRKHHEIPSPYPAPFAVPNKWLHCRYLGWEDLGISAATFSEPVLPVRLHGLVQPQFLASQSGRTESANPLFLAGTVAGIQPPRNLVVGFRHAVRNVTPVFHRAAL